MFLLVLLLCTGSAFGASTIINVNGTEKMYYDINEADILFEQFILDHGRNYETETEKSLRFQIFKEKLKEINELNMMHHDSIHGINMFTDLTDEEFYRRYASGVLPSELAMPCTMISMKKLATRQFGGSLDWRQRNVVSSVKNQHTCGSCWAHSIIGCLESQYAMRTGQQLDLSEQQLVDCEPTNRGCDPTYGGGWPSSAGIYIMEKGVMSESDYPYVNYKGTCRYNPFRAIARASSCIQLDGSSEEELKAALAQYGPISIVIDSRALHTYVGGILRQWTSKSCNHAVLLVGYNEEGNVPYWIIKNSWGTQFGEQGYFRIPMGSAACMITRCQMVVLKV